MKLHTPIKHSLHNCPGVMPLECPRIHPHLFIYPAIDLSMESASIALIRVTCFFFIVNCPLNSLRNRVKIVPGESLAVPRDLSGAAWGPAGSVFEAWRRSIKNLKRSGCVPKVILGPSRAQPAPKNQQKRGFCSATDLGKRFWKSFFIDFAFRRCFCSIFGRKVVVFPSFLFVLSSIKNTNYETNVLSPCRQRTLKTIVFRRKSDDFQEITFFPFKQFSHVLIQK